MNRYEREHLKLDKLRDAKLISPRELFAERAKLVAKEQAEIRRLSAKKRILSQLSRSLARPA